MRRFQRMLVIAAVWVAMTSALWAGPAASFASEEFRYDSKERRDPFIPLVLDGKLFNPTQDAEDTGQRSPAATPILGGILWDPVGTSIALLNGTEVKVGQAVAGYRVADIRQDAAVLVGSTGESLALGLNFDNSPSKNPSTSSKVERKP